MKEVGLSIGSNRGDRMAFLSTVRSRLDEIPGCKVVAASSVYETEPVDVPAEYLQYKYLNAVIIIETEMAPQQIHQCTKKLEDDMGRKRERNKINMPRLIDIDVLYIGDETVSTSTLTVPHPRWASREFVLRPLAEVRPEIQIPGVNRTPASLLAELPCQGVRFVCDASKW